MAETQSAANVAGGGGNPYTLKRGFCRSCGCFCTDGGQFEGQQDVRRCVQGASVSRTWDDAFRVHRSAGSETMRSGCIGQQGIIGFIRARNWVHFNSPCPSLWAFLWEHWTIHLDSCKNLKPHGSIPDVPLKLGAFLSNPVLNIWHFSRLLLYTCPLTRGFSPKAYSYVM